MMEHIAPFIRGLLPSVFTGLLMFYWQRRQGKKDEESRHRADIRKKEMQLTMQMQNAVMELSVGTALAVKNGKANGEMEEGLDACGKAKKAYYTFINRQAIDNISD